MIENLQAAVRRGILRVPFAELAPNDTALPPPAMAWGGTASLWDRTNRGFFASEKDWLVWLLAHNVSVCDLGSATNTTRFRYKGIGSQRRTRQCQAGPGSRCVELK